MLDLVGTSIDVNTGNFVDQKSTTGPGTRPQSPWGYRRPQKTGCGTPDSIPASGLPATSKSRGSVFPPAWPGFFFFRFRRLRQDSFFEYLLKGYILFQDLELLDIFLSAYAAARVPTWNWWFPFGFLGSLTRHTTGRGGAAPHL